MKKTLLIAVFVGMSHGIMSQDIRLPEYIRNPQPLDFSPFASQDKGREIIVPVAEYTPPDNYSDIEKAVQEAVDRAKNEQNIEVEYNVTQTLSGGIRFDNYSSVPTVDKEAYRRQKAAEQAQREQRDAERAAFYAKRRAQMAEAAARAAAEQRRKEEERMRIFNNEYNKELQRAAGHYARQHAVINQRTTTGRDYMMNYRVAEKMESSYTPSIGNTAVSASDIIGVIPKRLSRGNPPIIILSEHAVPNTGQSEYDDYNYNEVFDRLKSDENRQRQYKLKDSTENAIWTSLRSKWDGGQWAAMEYIMKEYASPDIIEIEDKNGAPKEKMIKALPNAIGIIPDGSYVFGDDNHVFMVSEDGRHLTVATFDSKDWSDDNIIKKIKDGGITEYCKESFSLSSEFGELSLKDLKEWKPEKLNELMPQIKAELKLSLLNNSDKIDYQYYYIPPQSKTVAAAGNVWGVPLGANVVVGHNMTTEYGGKITAGANATFSPNVTVKEGDIKGGIQAEAGFSIGASVGSIEHGATLGSVIQLGDKYYLVSGQAKGGLNAGVSLGAKVGTKGIEGKFLPLKVGIGINVFTDITPDDMNVSNTLRIPSGTNNASSSGTGHGGGGGDGR